MTLHAQLVSGFDMKPFYNGFTELWSQWAFDDLFAVTVGQQKHRFTHDRNVADEDDSLLAQRRYERTAGVNTGDLYQAGYAGFNYYIAGHRIKLINGIEYASMNGHDVWTASVAFRVFWGPHSNGPFPMAKTLKPRS